MINLRATGFWSLDSLQGGKVSRELADVKAYNELSTTEDYRSDYLEKLINHALKTVPFYKNSTHDITKLPVIDKGQIKSNLNSFVSSDFSEANLKRVVTSGSTGLPFQTYKDHRKIIRNTADTIYFGSLVDFQIGEPLAYLKIWNEFNKKSKIKQSLENVYPINVLNLSDRYIFSFLKYFNSRFKILHLLGYASAIERIADFILSNDFKLDFKIGSIITMSEGLDLNAKKCISRAFNTEEVYARYSNVENGILSQQIPTSNFGYVINTASYYLEILDENNNPSGDGNPGRIVVTDYFNYGMPMIRYDTGDVGTVKTVKIGNKLKRVLSSIEGRKMDLIFNTEGELVSSFNITNGMWKYPELLQYQFIQESNGEYLFKLNSPSGFKREDELISDFKKVLGENAKIYVEYVSEIPLLASGKRKKVVNKMASNK